MCALQAGQKPVQKVRAVAARAVVARVASAAMLATLAGCASNQTTSSAQQVGANVRVAQVVTEVEDDGLPAQVPPTQRVRQMPDDPSQPFSRNYGGPNPSASAAPLAEPASEPEKPNPKIPDDLPPAFRQKLAAAMAEDE